jgi:hypothetical protein
VAEVAAIGTVAVVFGLSSEHTSTPQRLVSACRNRRLPLLEAAEDASFVELTNRIVLAEGDPATVARRQLDQHRRVRELVREGGDRQALVAFLHRETNLDLGLYGVDGRPLAVLGRPAPDSALGTAIRLALGRSLPADIGNDYSAFDVPGSGVGSLMVVAKPLSSIDDEDRAIIEQVATFAAVQDEREQADNASRVALLSEVVASLWADEITDNVLAYRLSSLGLEPNWDHVFIATELSLADLSAAVRTCDASWVVARLHDWSVALVPAGQDERLQNLRTTLRDLRGAGSVGFGSPGRGSFGLRRSLVEAVGGCLLWGLHDSATSSRTVSYASLIKLVPPQMTRAFAESVLGPVRAWDEKHHTELMTTLECFIRHDGHLQVTATELRIHQNTLRFRLNRIAQLSGRSFDSIQHRVDLIIALNSFG